MIDVIYSLYARFFCDYDEGDENVTRKMSLVHNMLRTTRKLSHPTFLWRNYTLDISPEYVTLDISSENVSDIVTW